MEWDNNNANVYLDKSVLYWRIIRYTKINQSNQMHSRNVWPNNTTSPRQTRYLPPSRAPCTCGITWPICVPRTPTTKRHGRRRQRRWLRKERGHRIQREWQKEGLCELIQGPRTRPEIFVKHRLRMHQNDRMVKLFLFPPASFGYKLAHYSPSWLSPRSWAE